MIYIAGVLFFEILIIAIVLWRKIEKTHQHFRGLREDFFRRESVIKPAPSKIEGDSVIFLDEKHEEKIAMDEG